MTDMQTIQKSSRPGAWWNLWLGGCRHPRIKSVGHLEPPDAPSGSRGMMIAHYACPDCGLEYRYLQTCVL